MSYKVGVIRGDGIGPEIVAEALKVLDKVAEKYNEKFDYTDILLAERIAEYRQCHPVY